MHPLPSRLDVGRLDVAAVAAAAVLDRRDDARSNAHIRVEDVVALPRHRQHQTFDELDRELARVDRLFDMVVLDVGNDPDVARVLAKRVAGELAGLGAFEILLPGYLDGTRTGSRLKVKSSPLVNQRMVS